MLNRFTHVQLFCNPMECSPPGSSVNGDSPGKNTGIGCHFLLQRLWIYQNTKCQNQIHHLSDYSLSNRSWLLLTPYDSNICASQVVLAVKNFPANAGGLRDSGSIPGSGRSSGGGHGNPFQYSCLENPMDRGACWVKVHGVAKSQTQLRQLSRHTCTYMVYA